MLKIVVGEEPVNVIEQSSGRYVAEIKSWVLSARVAIVPDGIGRLCAHRVRRCMNFKTGNVSLAL